MVTTNKELPTKDLLPRSTIRTMKKDLVALREADALQEKQKISQIKIEKQKPVEVPRPAPQENRQEGLEKLLHNNVERGGEHFPDPERIKTLATEAEKQKMFLLKSQQAHLENDSKSVNVGNESLRVLEKNNILAQKQNLQKKLQDIAKQEESRHQEPDTDKKRWSVEREIAGLEAEEKDLAIKDQQSQLVKMDTEKQKENINNSLTSLYATISEREQNVIKKTEAPIIKAKSVSSEVPKKVQPQFENREYLQGVSLLAKEKLAESAAIEENRRTKFMEDVERWAASSSE